MPHVESSAISSADHCPRAGTLIITFLSGRRYAYFDVPRSEYEALLAAESKGTFVNARIKPRYRYEELRPLTAEP
jgi:hypothetical protein